MPCLRVQHKSQIGKKNIKNFHKFTGKERTGKLEQLKRNNAVQQTMSKSGGTATEAGFVVKIEER